MLSKLFTFSLLLLSMSTFAQHPVCGLPGGHEDDILIERLIENKRAVASAEFQRSGGTRWIGVIIHDIRNNDDSGAVSISRMFDMICNVNEFYEDQNVDLQFYLEEINIINNSTAYSDHSDQGDGVLVGARKSGFVNIFVPENANPSGIDPGGTVLGYYSPSDDWIVLRPQEVSGFSSTLHHEMGHYLSLPHPFRGWDFEYYEEAIHGEQVGTFAPSTGFNFNIRNEMEDGSNCSIAGDLICDTKPDYAPYTQGWGCNYTGGVKDPNGDEIDPDETNVMSYFGCSPETFTSDQIDLMQADMNQRLSTNGMRRLDAISDPSTTVADWQFAIKPINDESVENNADILFDWEDVIGASTYLIEIDRIQNFVLAPQRFLVTESKLDYTDDDLLLGVKYYWRVKAVDGYDLCADWSPVSSFLASTISSVNTIKGLNAVNIFPNPSQQGSAINLNLSAETSFNADLEIVNISGVRVNLIRDFDIQAGNNTYDINQDNLAAGVYFLKIVSELGTVQEKFIIQ